MFMKRFFHGREKYWGEKWCFFSWVHLSRDTIEKRGGGGGGGGGGKWELFIVWVDR